MWCDLSTFSLEGAKSFYAELFGWSFCSSRQPDQSEYLNAAMGMMKSRMVAGIYEMPEKFQAMNMPSFWMSYIEVDDINLALKRAGEFPARLEFGPADFGEGMKIALIRDPLGAGFTMIEGKKLKPRPVKPKHGNWAWSSLFLSDAKAVIPFYQTLFGWRISPMEGHWNIKTARGALIGDIETVPPDLREDKEYWAVYFLVKNLDEAIEDCQNTGGELIFKDQEGSMASIRDHDGASLFLITNSARRGGPHA